MSQAKKKFPSAVKAIYVAGRGAPEVKVVVEEPEPRRSVSRRFRGLDRELRAMALASAEYFRTYATLHEASSHQTRNGAFKHMAKNSIKAHKAAYEVLRDNSNVFDYEPTKIYDNLVEYLEDVEEEYEVDEEEV